MANFLVENCFDSNNRYRVEAVKEPLTIGQVIQVFSFDTEQNLGCFTVIQETLLQPNAFVGSKPSENCLTCFAEGGYYFQFQLCGTQDTILISANQFEKLPTMNDVFQIRLNDAFFPSCYKFIGVVNGVDSPNFINGEVLVWNNCQECIDENSFTATYNETLYKNNSYDLSKVVSLSGNYLEPVSFSFGMLQPINVTIVDNILQIGDFTGQLQILVLDSTDQTTTLSGEVQNRFIGILTQDILRNNTYKLDELISISGDCTFPVTYSLGGKQDLPFNPTPMLDVIIDFPIDIDNPVQENPIQIDGNNLIVGDYLGFISIRITDSTEDYFDLNSEVLSRESFNTLVQEYANNPAVQQKYAEFKNNYSNFINNRGGGNPAQEAK